MKKKIILIILSVTILVLGVGAYTYYDYHGFNYLVDFYTGSETDDSAERIMNRLSSVTVNKHDNRFYCDFEKYGVEFSAEYVVSSSPYTPISEITYKITGNHTAEKIQNAYDEIYKAYKWQADEFNRRFDNIGFSWEEETQREDIYGFGISGLGWQVAFSKDYDDPCIRFHYQEIA